MDVSRSTTLKVARLQEQAHALSSRRTPDTSDMILVCGNREFHAHKTILEASTPYFGTMFHNDFKEATSKKITLQDIEAETLEVVLDFIYSGEVSKMKSEDGVKNVLAQSHMMELKELFNYCCLALQSAITWENCFKVWNVGITYEIESLKITAMEHLFRNIGALKDREEFSLLPYFQLKEFITYCKTTRLTLDHVLDCLINWILRDRDCREKETSALFACLDVTRITKGHMKQLLKNENVMTSSEEIRDRINELGVGVLLAESPGASFLKSISSKERSSSELIEEHHAGHAEKLKKERWQQLAFDLQVLRKPETSDIILICGELEFYAHKVVLEASSPYFDTMLNSGLEEAKSGKIVFNEMEPESLGAILDYIYLGEVEKVQSDETIKEVLTQAHLLQLKDLFNYCCEVLEVKVSVDNIFDLCQIGLRYEHMTLTSKVVDFLLDHFDVLMNNSNFNLLTLEELKKILELSKDKVACLDKILKVLVKWLAYDVPQREMLAAELFACVDVKLVSKACVKSIVENADIMNSSTKIASRINELSISILLAESGISEQQPLLKKLIPILRAKRRAKYY